MRRARRQGSVARRYWRIRAVRRQQMPTGSAAAHRRSGRILNRWRRQGGSSACQGRARNRYCAPSERAGWIIGQPRVRHATPGLRQGHSISRSRSCAPGTVSSWNVPLTFEPFLPSPWIHVDRHRRTLLSDNIIYGIVHCFRTPTSIACSRENSSAFAGLPLPDSRLSMRTISVVPESIRLSPLTPPTR